MKTIIVDNRITAKCERSLMKEGFNLIKLPADVDLGTAVSSHPDTVLFYANREIITTADYCDIASYVFSDIREYCPDVKISFTCDTREAVYPKDCIMNALVIGKKIFCKKDSVSRAILSFAANHGYEVINTSQGYAACTTLAFGEHAITSDRGLASLLENNGISVTLIEQGGISLPPYEYGFIGGASGVVGSKVYFFGDIKSHPEGEKICSAIVSAGYTPISLSDERLADFGGIIAL